MDEQQLVKCCLKQQDYGEGLRRFSLEISKYFSQNASFIT